MIHKGRWFIIIVIIYLLCFVCSIPFVVGCKDLIAIGDATAGDYSLMLKVRDPSRPGLQVLCRIPEGYTYSYHHPWTGKSIHYSIDHTTIGVATLGDTPPEIFKAGMVLTDAGLAFGDADTMSNWVNPTQHAWDDFDWIRYAFQKADTIEEATMLFTKDVVDTMHAPGNSENLFIISPEKAVVIEADAVHHVTHQVDDIWAMTNYPKALWKTQRMNTFPVARSFDQVTQRTVRQGQTIHLGSLYGIRIMDIEKDHIIVRQVPMITLKYNHLRILNIPVLINNHQEKTVGDYRVRVGSIMGKTAEVRVSTNDYAWEQHMLEQMEEKKGHITLQDMMNWSRFHEEDMNGLRPMCEDRFPYEASMVFKIPEKQYHLLSSGWFAANHACSSIYVPVHICNTKIYEPFTNGEAAELCKELLNLYGHGQLIESCKQVETVFLNEITAVEDYAMTMVEDEANISYFFTEYDMDMQQQSWLMLQLWKESAILPTSKQSQLKPILEGIWEESYEQTLVNLNQGKQIFQSYFGINNLKNIVDELQDSIEKSITHRDGFYLSSKKEATYDYAFMDFFYKNTQQLEWYIFKVVLTLIALSCLILLITVVIISKNA